MAIEKRISSGLIGAPIFGGETKIANVLAPSEIHIPEELQEWISKLVPDPRFAYMHIIAMSDGDHYGSNLNGDIFEWPELTGTQSEAEAEKNIGHLEGQRVPRYKTFETSKFYRRHANRPDSPFFGDIPLAVANDPMKRIEIIVRIARQEIPELGMQGAPDIASRLDDGKPLTGSMGCRITYEKCTYCGHENELIPQRCNHMKHMMGEVMPNGVKVAAKNYGFRLFDYSDVIIPADPIAMSLSKVAELLAGYPPNEAKDLKTAEPWRQKWSEITKIIPSDSIGHMCTEGDTTVHEPEEYKEEELKKAMAAVDNDVDSVVATATALGIVFSPLEFAKLASFVTPEDHEGIAGFTGLALDKFSYYAYDALRSKVASRSGFVAPCHRSGWDPIKIAEAGHRNVGDYYAFYRAAVSSLPASAFTKVAHKLNSTHHLLGTSAEWETRLKAAMFYLARAGLGA